MGRMSDERFNELLSQTADPAAIARGLEIHQSLTGQSYPGAQPRRTQDKRHQHYFDVRTDEILYRAGLLPRGACHRDADLTATPDTQILARDLLSFAGQSIPDRDQNRELFTRAVTSSDLPLLLENIGAKALSLGYNAAAESWPLWTRFTTTRDFKEFSRAQAVTWPTPPEVQENSAPPFASLDGDSSERSAVKSYAEILSVSREALLNDDLKAITLDAFAAGRAVSRLIGDLCVAALTDNAAMNDGVALFHASHGNVGTPAAPSVVALDEMFGLFAAQTGPRGESLNLRPRYVLAPATLQSTLSVLREATNTPDPSNQSTGSLVTLTDSRLTGTGWYGLADPRMHDAIQVVVLEGTENQPRFERTKRTQNNNSDSMHFAVGYDVVVVPVDYRTVASNAGA